MRWTTRARPKVDRIACPWLITHFIDPQAEIVYVAPHEISERTSEGDITFDAPGARYDHRDGKCTFEVLLEEFSLLEDAALARLARIVHAADVDSDGAIDPFAPAIRAMAVGGLDVEPDDNALLQRAEFVYDALYAWCRRETAVA